MEFYMIVAIAAGLFFALRNTLSKYAISNCMRPVSWYYLYTALGLIIFPIVSWMISPPILPSVQSMILITISAAAAFVGSLIFIYALEKGDVTTAMPILSTRPMFVLVLSFVFLQEFYGLGLVVWALMIVVGAILASFSEGVGLKKILRSRNLGTFLFVTILYSTMSIAGKPVLQEITSYNYLGWWNLVQIPMLLIFMPFVFKKAEKDDFKKNWRRTMPIALVEIVFLYLSTVAMFYSIKFSASITESLAATQGLFTVVIGFLLSFVNPKLLAEKHTKKIYLLRLIGALLILIGVYEILV
jgi:drug/metabolite transporter (DMT)-like permease